LGDPRAMALTGALAVFVHVVAGFTNKSLRAGRRAARIGLHLHPMTYDLRRLRLHGLIERIPHTNTLTADGIRVAILYTKVHSRILRPLIAAADQPPAPLELRRALATLDRVINEYAEDARLAAAA
jgi:predicted MarR family transcription regulator